MASAIQQAMLMDITAAVPGSIAYQASGHTAIPGTSPYTVTSMAIGPAAAGRYVLVGVAAYGASSLPVVTCTLGGTTMTDLGSYSPDGQSVAHFFILAVAAGTTANLVISYSVGLIGLAYGAWSLNGLKNAGAATDIQGATAASASVTLSSVPAGGVVAAISTYGSTGDSIVWTGVNSDFSLKGAPNIDGGSIALSALQSSYVVSYTGGNGGTMLLAVSLR